MRQASVVQALKGQERLRCEFDFGDAHRRSFAVCLDDRNACPPENCGGSGGHPATLEALANPAHDEREQYLEWPGGDFDASTVDVAAANVALQLVR